MAASLETVREKMKVDLTPNEKGPNQTHASVQFMRWPMKGWQRKEVQARRAIEDQGFVVHDANVLFHANCPNIDLVVFGKNAATYVQVKSSQKPAGSDAVIVDGSAWTEDQLRNGGPLFNRHDGFKASLIVIVAATKAGETEFYIAPPAELERLLVPRARAWADHPKRDGQQRSIAFRKELPREALKPWLNAWQQLGEP